MEQRLLQWLRCDGQLAEAEQKNSHCIMNQSVASHSSTRTGTTPLYGCEMDTNSATVPNNSGGEGGFGDPDRLSDDGCKRSNSGGAAPTIPGPSPRRALGRSAAADSCDVELRFRSSERVTSSLG